MRKKLVSLTFMLGISVAVTGGLKAQTDGYFSNESELRSSGTSEVGIGFNDFSGRFGQGIDFAPFEGQQGGMGFESFTGGDAPLGNGLLLMTATGIIYLINKRRKENEQ